MSVLAMGVANHVDTLIARRFGDRCPFVLVAEFPRSGGNWIRDVLSDVLQIPVSRRNLLPTTTYALVQSHTASPIQRGPCVYNLRDGRDVLVSHFWHSLNSIRAGPPAARRRLAQLHPSLARLNRAPSDANLRAFYEEWRVRPAGARASWGQHVGRWLSVDNPKLCVLRYEDLLERPHDALAGIAEKLTGAIPQSYVLEFAVRRNAFETKTGRKPGEILNTDRRRSGRVGGWRDELPTDLQRRFTDDFGEALALAGYEV